jgi:putative chitinase
LPRGLRPDEEPEQRMEAWMRVVDVVKNVAPRCYPNYLKAFDGGDALFKTYDVATPLRIAHFLAQALYETGGGTVLFENMAYKTPERLLRIFGVGRHTAAIRPDEVPRLLDNPQALAERVYGLGNPKKATELGNDKPGDGYRYRGGGLLQTTGGGNYRKMGQLCGVNFYDSPDEIVSPESALRPALDEWSEGKLNGYADNNDIRVITRSINGGYNGLQGRLDLFDKIWSIVRAEGANQLAWQAAQPDEDTRWLQESLDDLGVVPPLVIDGRYGPATTEAVKWFQTQAGLVADGNAGEVTRAAIKLRLSTT